MLGRHFTAVSVANNLTGDGSDAFSRQLTMFSDAGLFWFGGRRNQEEARRPLIVESNGLRIALLGYNGFPALVRRRQGRPGVAWLNEGEMLADIRAARRSSMPMLHTLPALGHGSRAGRATGSGKWPTT